jgi:sialate O-acetylesterase
MGEKNLFGVIIEQGPQPWAIIQQVKGKASVQLSGSWTLQELVKYETAQVYVRWVKEVDSSVVMPWQQAKMLDDQRWEVTVHSVPAGGLYRIETCLQLDSPTLQMWPFRGDTIHHLGIGDIWVIAGQSNSAGYGKGPFIDHPQLGVHLLRNRGKWDLATHPFNESTDTIRPLNRDFTNPAHSPYLVFGKMIANYTGMPVGFLPTALGGSALRKWNPDEEGDLYRNMMEVIASAGGQVKGVLWYQGESDCNLEEAESYLRRFHNMVHHLRQDLKNPELPILTVQLNRLTDIGREDDANNRSWGMIRETQRQAAEQISDVYVVPTLDCPLSDEIHNSPAGNMLIGERLANTALTYVYKNGQSFHAPNFISAVYHIDAEKHQVSVRFSHVQGHLFTMDPTHCACRIEDDQGEIELKAWPFVGKDTIELELARAIQGEAFIHGAYEANPVYHLPTDSATYMPMLAFYKQPITNT